MKTLDLKSSTRLFLVLIVKHPRIPFTAIHTQVSGKNVKTRDKFTFYRESWITKEGQE